MDTGERALAILSRLRRVYPETRPALDYQDAWGLLVATVLAAQCTDERVNMVTPELFRRWPGPGELMRAEQAQVEEVVRSTGFFRNKAKNLIAAARLVTDEFGGEVPRTMAELVRLPGVARKTAAIVLYNVFGVNEGVAVDTHVTRLSFRLGLTESDKQERIEQDLMGLFPRQEWGELNHLLVFHGRGVCTARKPLCPQCVLDDICPKMGVAQAGGPQKGGAPKGGTGGGDGGTGRVKSGGRARRAK